MFGQSKRFSLVRTTCQSYHKMESETIIFLRNQTGKEELFKRLPVLFRACPDDSSEEETLLSNGDSCASPPISLSLWEPKYEKMYFLRGSRFWRVIIICPIYGRQNVGFHHLWDPPVGLNGSTSIIQKFILPQSHNFDLDLSSFFFFFFSLF